MRRSKVSIWQDDTKLGEAAAAAEVDVTFGEAVTLAEGDNLFIPGVYTGTSKGFGGDV